ncbi:MAG: class I SAM-dependent methyltransferase [Longimicrobiales bacterium]
MSTDHFSERADLYARFRPTYPPALADALALHARGRSLAWDAGCGSGQLSVALAGVFDRVHATDLSPAQLEGARPHPGVHYACEDSGACSLGDGAAELVVAAQAAHWFDLEAFYAEAARVGGAGGIVALVSYGATRIAPELDRVIEAFRLGTLGPHWPPGRCHVEDGYASLPFPFAPLPAPSLDLRAHWTVDEFLGYVASWSGTRRLLKAEGRDRLEAFGREIRALWGSGRRLVGWPLAIRQGRI